jgi:N-hydroxyarylamine O-acetyltransferase
MDFGRYLTRIGMPDAPPHTSEGLARLQQAHRLAIAFENLDIHLGREIVIDPGQVFDKLVVQGRGGYCFEQNRLYADALSALGVANRPLLARVRLNVPADVVPPRTHVCLLATLGGRPWLADAGFGGSNVPPLPLEDGAEAITADGAYYRLVRVTSGHPLDGTWRLERSAPGGQESAVREWQPQYTFDLDEVAPVDIEQANHWVSTRPGTRFTSSHIVSIPLPDGFAALTDRELTVSRLGTTERRLIVDPAQYAETLRQTFRIVLDDAEVHRLPLFA